MSPKYKYISMSIERERETWTDLQTQYLKASLSMLPLLSYSLSFLSLSMFIRI